MPAGAFALTPFCAVGLSRLITSLPSTFTFDTPVEFLFPWTKQLWQQSQIPAQAFMGGDWYRLYSGGSANVAGNINCALEGHTLAYKLPVL